MVQPRRPSELAALSFVAALLGLSCLPGLGALLAIPLGIAAHYEIAHSRGRKSGAGLAWTGIVLGGLTLATAAAGLLALALSPPDAARRPAKMGGGTGTPPSLGAPAYSSPEVPSSPPNQGTQVVTIGHIELVDIGVAATTLNEELDRQREAAERAHRTLLLWINRRDCRPCNGVAAALLDPEVQEGLGSARLVRVDVEDFTVELEALGVPTRTVPGFALLGTNNRPVDYLHGGEWDADIPANIAPVLSAFIRRTYPHRRHPWRSARDDEATPI